MITPQLLKELSIALEHDKSRPIHIAFIIGGDKYKFTTEEAKPLLPFVSNQLEKLINESINIELTNKIPCEQYSEFEDI